MRLLNCLLAATFVFVMTSSALAVPVDVTYTADNIANTWFLQSDVGIAENFAAGENRNDWRFADTASLDLEAGTSYSLIWSVSNVGDFSASNPAGFLAQIDLGEELVLSSSTWTYSLSSGYTDDFNSTFWTWYNAVEYGYNGGANIWTTNLGGAVAGISTDAQWIWSNTNFADGQDQDLYVRVDFETAPVPEPSTFLLLGGGLVGLAYYRRRKS